MADVANTQPAKPEPSVSDPQSPLPKRETPVPIVYDLPVSDTAASRLEHLVKDTHTKFAARAARFGENVKPRVTELDVLGARRTHVRHGFASGFDPIASDQAEKRAARAKRFGYNPETEDPNIARRARAKRFGGNALDLTQELLLQKDPLEKRRDVAVGELLRDNVLHAFGVDMMSTSQVLHHFREYGPSWCEWLNDSTCNIALEDEHTMKRTLRGMTDLEDSIAAQQGLGDAPEDKMDDAEGAGKGLAVAGTGTLTEELKWRRAKPFHGKEGLIPIWIRQATEKDVRPEIPNPHSKWSRTVNDHRVNGRKRNEGNRSGGREREGLNRRRRGDRVDGSHDREQRPSRRGTSLGVHSDRKQAIMKAQAKKVSRMDLDRALGS